MAADLRWRDRDWYAALHQRARTYYITRLAQTQGQEQQRVLFDYIFLHRDNSAIKPYFTWQESSNLFTGTLRETDQPALLRMVTQHEGEASARLAAHWFKQQPQGVLTFRDAEQQPTGFVIMVAVNQASTGQIIDPAVQSVWRYLQEQAPLRPGEGATLLRFWMARDTYQAVSPLQSLIFINFIQHHQSTGRLAFTFFSCAEPDFWAELFAYADLARIPEADFEVGGRHYGVYGHDWRAMSRMAWQALLAQREIDASAQARPPSQISEPLVVLSQPEFVGAVRDALRNFSCPSALQGSPLQQSRLIVERVAAQTGKTKRITVLQALVREAAESLQSSPREAKYYQALYHAYLYPAPTQEEAAELLGLPLSTFRRHLKRGVTRVIEILWDQEISG